MRPFPEQLVISSQRNVMAYWNGRRTNDPQYSLASGATLLEQKLNEGTKMLQCIKVTLLTSLNGYAPQVAVEFGRKVLYSTERPTFTELESEVKQRKGK